MKLTKEKLSWALYDWADSAFATTVMAVFFPVFFKEYWASGADATQSTFYLGLANSLAGLAVALIAPTLGAIADKGSAKKKLLLTFAFIGALSTLSLAFIAQGYWFIAAIVFAVGIVGFSGAHAFYDALLMNVSNEKDVDSVSSLGYSLGYLGGGLLLLLNILMYQMPHIFGIPDGSTAVKISFALVGLWWAGFTIPIMVNVKETKGPAIGFGKAIVDGFKQLVMTMKKIASFRNIVIFLLAYWFYIDGVDTVIKMAVDYGSSIGFSTGSLIAAILMVQFIGFPAALLTGFVAEKIGARKMLLISIGAYICITILAYFMSSTWHFFALAGIVGLFQGGIQALSRSYYSRLIPVGQSAEFFGFYNMLGKFATIIGPFLMGFVTLATGSNRLGILSIIILFIVGGILFMMVSPDKKEA